MGEQLQHTEIKSLTGLRGVAALYVVFYHFKISNFMPAAIVPFFQHGYLAVDLFFVLSGFVMALTYKSLFENGITIPNFTSFIGRRIARVYPLYIFITGLFMAFYYSFPHKMPDDFIFSTHLILSNILMIQAWDIGPSIVHAAWSISTEFGAYLLFPFLSMIVLWSGKQAAYISALIACVSLILLFNLSIGSLYEVKHLHSLNIWEGDNWGAMIRCVAEFTLGIWAYRLYTHLFLAQQTDLGFIQRRWGSVFLTFAIIVLLAIPSTDIAVVFLIPFLIIFLALEKSMIAKFLSWKPVYFLGQISYSLYLCHLMAFWPKPEITNILVAINFPTPYFFTIIIQIAMSLIFAAGLFYGLEKPSRKFFQKLNWSKHDKSGCK